MKHDGRRHASSSERAMNAVFVLIVVAILALGVYAAGSKLYTIHSQNAGVEDQASQTATTVGEKADELGISVDEMKAEYGLADDVNADTDLNNVYGSMTVANYAKLNGSDAVTFLDENHLTGVVDENTIMDDAETAYMKLPVKKVYSEEDLNGAMEAYNIAADEITDEMTLTEFNNLLNEKYNEKMLAEEAAQQEESAPAEDGAESAQPETDTQAQD